MKLFRYTILFVIAIFASSVVSWGQFTTEEKIDSTNANDVQEQKMELLVLDFKSKKPMEADVMIKGLNPRKTVVFKDVSDSTLLLKKYRIYTVSVIKKGYMYFAHRFWPDEAETHVERIELKPLSVGLKSSIEDITFLGDETQIYHKSAPALEELIEFLTLNPSVSICVIGHVNGPVNEDQKSDSFYRKASEKRAQAVVDYLIQHGVAKERLTSRGMGNKQMIYPDPQTEWQVSANRRIEIEVTGM
ncbi:MAG: OmpA family protein [Flavobacteriales bacterium]|nr:OmpA family protein [Flavobacteriales bacterium]